MLRNIVIVSLILLSISAIIPKHKAVSKTVRIKGMKFIPSTIEVNVGDTVIWMAEGSHHNVVAGDGSFKSSMLKKGDVYALVFSKAGQYKYYCQPHRIMGMKGVVEVKE